MNCPRCMVELKVENYTGIEVDRCPSCQGMWLDYGELDELEDVVLDIDEAKGTMIYKSSPGQLACPVCSKSMQRFNYRFYNLELDFCDEGHGTWLDEGEEKRVLELMEQRIKDLKRKVKAEAEWGKMMKRLRSPSFFDKLKRRFKK